MDFHPLSCTLEDILFLDIETVSGAPSFDAMNDEWKALFADKTRAERERDGFTPEEFYAKRAGIQAEFGKVVVIGLGYFSMKEGALQFRVTSLQNSDEKVLLQDFSSMLLGFSKRGKYFPSFCAHNGKEFDFPYLSRRYLINGLPMPPQLQTAGKKPWEVFHLDTMELWKFGDRKNYTSLKLLAGVFGLPSPKDDMDGSMVGPAFWNDNNLEGIARYCRKDVSTLAQVYLRMRGEPSLPPDQIHEVE